MKPPKLYSPIKIKFWSLRNGFGRNYGVIFDIDTEVERKVMRVKTPDNEWKFQIVDYNKLVEYDCSAEIDKEILDNHGMELEYEFVK